MSTHPANFNKFLKEISEKLDALFTEVRDANSVRVEIVQISSNEMMQSPHSGFDTAYVSKWRITLSGSVPSLYVSASGPVAYLRVYPEGGGIISVTRGTTFENLSNAFGPYILEILSTSPSTFQPVVSCQGVRCVRP